MRIENRNSVKLSRSENQTDCVSLKLVPKLAFQGHPIINGERNFKISVSDQFENKKVVQTKRVQATKIKEEGNTILGVKAMFSHMGTKQLHLYLIKQPKITNSFDSSYIRGFRQRTK